jgi:hypothetical protein
MSGTSTIYDVKVRYALDDKASQGVRGIATATDKAAQSAFSLKSALAAIGGVGALKLGKTLLVDFNSEIDQMKIGLTAVMQMQLKYPFEKARLEADKLFKVFQEMAKKSPATTKDFMEMGNAIAPVVAMMGGGPQKLAKLTQGGVLASQAFGERADIVALDIKQMLMGTVSSRDRIAQQLIASKGMDSEKFNALDSKKRSGMVESMLQDPALLKAADQMGASFKGQVSTLQDQLQITFGQAGLPLMQAMTSEIKKWNTWIEKHPKLIQQWVTSFGETVKSGFEFVKSVASWFIDHRDLLADVGKTLIMMKASQMAGNVFKRFTDGVGSLADTIKRQISTFQGGGAGAVVGSIGGFTGLASSLFTKVIPGLAAFSTAISVATSLLGSKNESDKKAREVAISLQEATGEIPKLMAQRAALFNMKKYAKDADLVERYNNEISDINRRLYSPETVGTALRKISEASEEHGGISLKRLPHNTSGLMHSNLMGLLPDTFDSRNIADNTRIMKEVDETLKMFQRMPETFREQVLKYAFPEQYGMPTPAETAAPSEEWKGVSAPEINVTIQKVEVAAEDPDRFVFGIVRIADNAIKHATQSQHAMPGGF